MKKNILLIVFIFNCQIIKAQTQVATPVVPHKEDNSEPVKLPATYYCCKSCDYTAKELRSCPLHQSVLIKVGTWYCPIDGKSSKTAGKCPDDKSELVLMKMKFKTVTPDSEDLKKDKTEKK